MNNVDEKRLTPKVIFKNIEKNSFIIGKRFFQDPVYSRCCFLHCLFNQLTFDMKFITLIAN
jgi:hypothetical protein